MWDSIQQQPEAIKRILDDEAENKEIENFAEKLINCTDVHIVGIGTSWHGTLIGESFLRTIAGRHDARAWNSFEFSSFPPTLTSKSAVIVLSHRGTKQFSLKSLELAKAAGATTALCNGLGSVITQEQQNLCNFIFRTSEQEKSSAFTISHTTAMTVLLLISIALGKKLNNPLAQELSQKIHSLPDLVQQALSLEASVEEMVKKVKDKSIFYFVGYGPNVSSCYETALKIKEACYVFTEGFQIEQYIHGPFCATDNRSCVIYIDPLQGAAGNHPGSPRVNEMIHAALEVEAQVCSLTNAAKDVKSDQYVEIVLPPMPEEFSPIVYLVILQLFTYRLALAHGKNPDRFRRDNPLYASATTKYKL